jgi:hypothetical protein
MTAIERGTAALPYPWGDRLEVVLRGIGIGLDAVCIRDRSRTRHGVAGRAVHWLFVAPQTAGAGASCLFQGTIEPVRPCLTNEGRFGDLPMRFQTLRFAFAMFSIGAPILPSLAQVANPELEACRSTGLIALRERNPSIKDVSFDVDGMTVAKANTKVENTLVKTIVIGDAYLEKGKQDTRRTFLCLIGEKGKVLLTFFTDK